MATPIVKMTIEDKSNFLRGFLILIRKDQKIEKYEKKMALIIGKYFGFSESFCETAIEELLENEYISEEPPLFSNKAVARFFLDESFKIMNHIHETKEVELEWLKKIAAANNLKLDSAFQGNHE